MSEASNQTETKGAFYEESTFIIGIVCIILIVIVELVFTLVNSCRNQNSRLKHKQTSYSLYFTCYIVFIFSGVLNSILIKDYVSDLNKTFYKSYFILSFLFNSLELFLLLIKRKSSSGLFEALQISFGGFAQIIIFKCISELSSLLLVVTLFKDLSRKSEIEASCYYVLTFSIINSFLYAFVRYFDPFQKLILEAHVSYEQIREIKVIISIEINNVMSCAKNILEELIKDIIMPPNSVITPIVQKIRDQIKNINVNISDIKKLEIKVHHIMRQIKILATEKSRLMDLNDQIKKFEGESHSQYIKVDIEDTERFITAYQNEINIIHSVVRISKYYFYSICTIRKMDTLNKDYRNFLIKIENTINTLNRTYKKIFKIRNKKGSNENDERMRSLFKDATQFKNEMNELFFLLDDVFISWELSHIFFLEYIQYKEKYSFVYDDIVKFMMNDVYSRSKQLNRELNWKKGYIEDRATITQIHKSIEEIITPK